MQTLQADYFAAYRNLKLSRDAKGVLVAEFHSDGGPFIMNAQAHTECTIAARVKTLAARDKRRCLRAHCPSRRDGQFPSCRRLQPPSTWLTGGIPVTAPHPQTLRLPLNSTTCA